jgi:hypothetical protein
VQGSRRISEPSPGALPLIGAVCSRINRARRVLRELLLQTLPEEYLVNQHGRGRHSSIVVLLIVIQRRSACFDTTRSLASRVSR